MSMFLPTSRWLSFRPTGTSDAPFGYVPTERLVPRMPQCAQRLEGGSSRSLPTALKRINCCQLR
jgi:hypothetical protein